MGWPAYVPGQEVPSGKSNQRPVSSVARSAESVARSVNKDREAYTGNTGRRGDVPPLNNSTS
jgi:hypothetical protein